MTVLFHDSSGSGKWSYQFVRFDMGIEFLALCEKVAQVLATANEAPPFSGIYVDMGRNLLEGELELLASPALGSRIINEYPRELTESACMTDKLSALRCAIGYPSAVVSTRSARRFRLEMGVCFSRVVEVLPVSQNTKERIQIEIRAWREGEEGIAPR